MNFQSCCVGSYVHDKSLFRNRFCLNLMSFISVLTWVFVKLRKIVAKQYLQIKNAFLWLTQSCIVKNQGFCLKIWLLYDVRSFRILKWSVSTSFLQVFTSVAFSKYFGAFIITIVGFTLKILKKNHLNFPNELVLTKKFIFSNHGKYVPLWIWKIFWSKIFFLKKINIRLLWDKSVKNFFYNTVSQSKVKPWLCVLSVKKINTDRWL